MIGRPQNELLQKLSTQDFELLAPHLQSVDLAASHILHHAGDSITAIHSFTQSGTYLPGPHYPACAAVPFRGTAKH